MKKTIKLSSHTFTRHITKCSNRTHPLLQHITFSLNQCSGDMNRGSRGVLGVGLHRDLGGWLGGTACALSLLVCVGTAGACNQREVSFVVGGRPAVAAADQWEK